MRAIHGSEKLASSGAAIGCSVVVALLAALLAAPAAAQVPTAPVEAQPLELVPTDERRPRRASRRPAGPEEAERSAPDAWPRYHGARPGWVWESAFGGAGGLLTSRAGGEGGSVRRHGAAGGFVRTGLLHSRPFRNKSLLTRGGKPADWLTAVALTVATGGLGAIPYDVWLGNERGLQTSVQLLGDPAGDRGLLFASVGVGPVLRITRQKGPFRFPSVLQVLLPEVGWARFERKDLFYVRVFTLPLTVLYAPRVGLELDLADLRLLFGPGERARALLGARLSLLVR